MKNQINLKIIFFTLALSLAFSPLIYAANTKNQTPTKKEVAKVQQDQAAEKRKEIFEEATAAIIETKNAINALDEKNNEAALAVLERASGKLTVILGREPELALAPADVNMVTFDILADINEVKELRDEIKDAIDDGRLQEARYLINDLASETVISVTSVPLATYPIAIENAAKLIDEGKLEDAKQALVDALNTIVITDTVIPLPVANAENMLKEAERLTGKTGRSETENKHLADLLINAREELKFAEVLGYGNKKDFKNLYGQLNKIEDKIKEGQSGSGLFDQIKLHLKEAFQSSQKSNPKEKNS